MTTPTTPRERVECPRSLFDAMVELHLAVQQSMQEAQAAGEPSEAAYERLAVAFVKSSAELQEHTKEQP